MKDDIFEYRRLRMGKDPKIKISKNVEKTVIKGYRSVKQLVGIVCTDYSIPEKKYIERFYESKSPLEIVDGELFWNSCMNYVGDSLANWTYFKTLYINEKEVEILKTYEKNDFLYIIVDINIEKENEIRDFQEGTILKEYDDMMNKRWDEFINKYSKNERAMELVDIYKKQNMSKKNIMHSILKDYEPITYDTLFSLSQKKERFNMNDKDTQTFSKTIMTLTAPLASQNNNLATTNILESSLKLQKSYT